jgi:hypothetical protein
LSLGRVSRFKGLVFLLCGGTMRERIFGHDE